MPEKVVLKNVSFYAKPGQKIAFVGATGAGKTTITNLINRFYDIAEGQIILEDSLCSMSPLTPYFGGRNLIMSFFLYVV